MADLKRIGKGLAGVFVDFKEDDDAPPTDAPRVANSDEVAAIPAVQTVNVSEDDPAYIELSNAVLGRDTAYTRFLKRFNSLTKVRDNDIRYQSALDVLSGDGVSKDDVLRAITAHIGILEQEKRTFDGVQKEKTDDLVGALERERASNTQSINSKRAEIARLQAEISGLEKTNTNLQTQISEKKSKIDSAARAFNVAAQTVKKRLESDKTKFSTLS